MAATKDYKWQVQLAGKWEDYSDQEHRILSRAYAAGFPNCRFSVRGQEYVYNFENMTQNNVGGGGKERRIRSPYLSKPRPAKPVIPPGKTMCIRVPEGASGTYIEVPHPDIAGGMFRVKVPETSRPGAMLMVPVPNKAIFPSAKTHAGAGGAAGAGGGLIVADKVEEAPPRGGAAASEGKAKDEKEKSKWTTGQKIAATGAVVGGVGVGAGVVLAGGIAAGHEIADPGSMEDFFVEGIPDIAEDVGDWVVDAGEDVGDFFMDLF